MSRKRNPLLKPKSDCKDFYLNYSFREARVRAGYSLCKLGLLVGVSTEAIHSYERLRCFPPKKTARRIIAILNMRLEERLKVEDVFPKMLREIDKVVRKARDEDKKQENVKYLGSNLDELEDTLSQEQGFLLEETPFDNVIYKELRGRVEQVLQTLSYKEYLVISMRYGLADTRGHTLEEIGKILGVSRKRVFQIEKRAVEKLRLSARAGLLLRYFFE